MFREAIRERMMELRITNKKLSEQTGIPASSISSLLSGARTTSNGNLDKILKALKLTLVPAKDFEFGSVDFSNEPWKADVD